MAGGDADAEDRFEVGNIRLHVWEFHGQSYPEEGAISQPRCFCLAATNQPG
jgi:hypothetical protein